ncbi:SecDF P1 head subdomain-containing protein [Amycolatopsis sp. cmx-8-4]|uniref:SecDF P1 head subdomain-containing protein n=1 Tax=Amycolatopsis sp. cmx-8-4 TaxID=2790947 RepID=UPI00397A5629
MWRSRRRPRGRSTALQAAPIRWPDTTTGPCRWSRAGRPTNGFKSEGTKIWADFTTKNTDQQVAIVVNSQVIWAPNIQVAILDGNTQIITGKFTEQRAQELARRLSGR